MKYLVLGCDVTGDRPLRDEYEPHSGSMPAGLSPDLIADLLTWNERMADAVQAAVDANSALEQLNNSGERLAERVAAAISGGAKVRYLRE